MNIVVLGMLLLASFVDVSWAAEAVDLGGTSCDEPIICGEVYTGYMMHLIESNGACLEECAYFVTLRESLGWKCGECPTVVPTASPTESPTRAPTSAPVGTITVRVVEFGTLEPIVGVTVTYSFPATGSTGTSSSDDAGLVTFDLVPPDGTFLLEASDPVTAASGNITGIVSAASLTFSAELALDIPGTSTLSGQVFDASVSPASSGVVVTYSFTVTGRTASTTTNEFGEYSFSGVQSDGVLIVVAFDTASEVSGSSSSFISADGTFQVVDITLSPLPENPNVELLNADFSSNLTSWKTSGPVNVVARDSVFEEQVTVDPGDVRRLKGEVGCPVTQAAIIRTDGADVGSGQISQAFIVPVGYELMKGRVQFLSDEWPEFFGSQYNDNFLATLTTSSGVEVLTSGSLNSATWTDGPKSGYNGYTADYNFEADLSGLAGQTVELKFEVRDVADLIFDSAIAIDATRVYDTEDFVVAPGLGGPTTSKLTVKGQLGQVVRITVENLNVLGTSVYVEDKSPFGVRKQSLILPAGEVVFNFGIFGQEPMYREFEIGTVISDAFIVNVKVESTWVEGMPPNPCF